LDRSSERLLNVREASAALGLSPWTIRAWISQRRIPYLKLGKAVRIDPLELAKYLNRCKVPPREEEGLE